MFQQKQKWPGPNKCLSKIRNINDLNVEILVSVFLLLDINSLCTIERGNCYI